MTTTENVTAVQGDSFVYPSTLVDGDGAAVDLSSVTVAAAVRDLYSHEGSSTLIATGTVTVDDAAAGQFTVTFSASDIGAVTIAAGETSTRLLWDVQATSGLDVETVVRGTFTVVGQVTP